MPAKSQDQKEFMQLALAVKTGEKDKSEVSQDVVDAAESMSKSELEKYAKSDVEERIRRVVREEIQSVLKEDHLSKNQLDQLDQVMMDFENSWGSLHNATENINMVYGDGGKNSETLSRFVDEVLSGLGTFKAQFDSFKELLKKEYPDYDWTFM